MKKKLLIAAAAVLILSVAAAGFLFYVSRTRNAVDELAEGRCMINILLAGSNDYRDRKFSFFAVLSINPENGNTGITFLPPSFQVRMGNGGKNIKRIDEVDFIYFDDLSRSLKEDLKLQIPFYVELYASDCERLTDLLEGINIFYLDQYGCGAFAEPGLNYFDGKKILSYINTVEENSIFLKYDRIMDILLTLYYRSDDKKEILTPDFMKVLASSVHSNLLPQEMYSLTKYLFREGADLRSIIMPGELEGNYYISNDITYKIYEKEFIGRLVAGTEDDSVPKIKILNATDVSGLARKMRNTLNRDGYNVVEFGTSPYGPLKKSIIICRKGDNRFAEKISDLTGISTVYYIMDNSLLYSTVIIIGDDLAVHE